MKHPNQQEKKKENMLANFTISLTKSKPDIVNRCDGS